MLMASSLINDQPKPYIRITGKIYSGQGYATQNHATLIPLLIDHFPPICGCDRYGTINVQLDQACNKLLADIWSPRIAWRPVWAKKPTDPIRNEAFGFIQIGFEFPQGILYRAWIIMPEGATQTFNDFFIEIITDVRISGIKSGARCAVNLDHKPSKLRPAWFGDPWSPASM
jgi:hypothetical protein